MPELAFNPDNDVLDLSGKVILITGGKLSFAHRFVVYLTTNRNGGSGCSVGRAAGQAFSSTDLYQRSERDKCRDNYQGRRRLWVKYTFFICAM